MKYSSVNYKKYSKLFIINDKLIFPHLLMSKTLLIKWRITNSSLRDFNNISGKIRVNLSDTLLGKLPPIDKVLNLYKDEFIQFLQIENDDLPYKLEVFNPLNISKSQIEIWEYLPDINYSAIPLGSPDMPTYPLSSSGSDPAIAAALAAQVSATAANTAAIAALPVAMAASINKPATTTGSFQIPSVPSTGGIQVSAKNDAIESLQFINTGNHTVRFWIQDTPLNLVALTYNDTSFDMELAPNSLWEVPAGECNSNIYAMSKTGTSSLSGTVSTIA